jgi:SAM-dependent methyltransferase
VWRGDRLWAPSYAFALNRPPLARLGAALLMQTDMQRLYEAIEMIGRQPDGAAILDIPCGGGVALRGLRPEQRVRYVAADIAPDMLRRTAAEARRRGLDQVETVEADIGALPYRDGEFDLTVTFTGLHCVPDPRRAVIELGRVTAPGGTLAGSFWASDVRRHQRPLQLFARGSGLAGRSLTVAELRAALRDGGCAAPAVERSGDFVYFSARRLAP